MQEQLDFLAKAVAVETYHSAAQCLSRINLAQDILCWVRQHAGEDALKLYRSPAGTGLSFGGSGNMCLKVDGGCLVAVAKAPDYTVVTEAELKSEDPWVTSDADEAAILLRLYQGTSQAAKALEALAEYRKAAAELGRAQLKFHDELGAIECEVIQGEIDTAVFEEGKISDQHIDRVYLGDD